MAKIPAHQEATFFSVFHVVLDYYICKGDGCCKDILLYGCYNFYAILIKKELGSENELMENSAQVCSSMMMYCLESSCLPHILFFNSSRIVAT